MSAEATVVTVTEPWTEGAYAPLPTPAAAEAAAVACRTLHIKDEHPAEGIIKAAKDQGCDLIIMGSHGRGPMGRISPQQWLFEYWRRDAADYSAVIIVLVLGIYFARARFTS